MRKVQTTQDAKQRFVSRSMLNLKPFKNLL